ncbi:hypothetical protein VP01_4526g1 [Puccinia sorghi]|uniref:Uncharacterized protein n=1 Tax=Puccinia sorghi TaxID=27349 RepID=A0A0L6UPT0_9BASI|nr:hypothetical protein VP01_4526g1 [Puccinia sorghi]
MQMYHSITGKKRELSDEFTRKDKEETNKNELRKITFITQLHSIQTLNFWNQAINIFKYGFQIIRYFRNKFKGSGLGGKMFQIIKTDITSLFCTIFLYSCLYSIFLLSYSYCFILILKQYRTFVTLLKNFSSYPQIQVHVHEKCWGLIYFCKGLGTLVQSFRRYVHHIFWNSKRLLQNMAKTLGLMVYVPLGEPIQRLCAPNLCLIYETQNEGGELLNQMMRLVREKPSHRETKHLLRFEPCDSHSETLNLTPLVKLHLSIIQRGNEPSTFYDIKGDIKDIIQDNQLKIEQPSTALREYCCKNIIQSLCKHKWKEFNMGFPSWGIIFSLPTFVHSPVSNLSS